MAVNLLQLLGLFAAATQPPSAVRLRVEYAEDPIGVDVAVPRFSWTVPL